MKKLLLIVAVLWAGVVSAQKAEIEQAVKYLQAGNSKDLVSLFSETVDLEILSESQMASQSQAEQILKKFFTNNAPKSFKVVHEGVTALEIHYCLGELTTSTGVYNVRINLKKAGDKFVIHQFFITTEE